MSHESHHQERAGPRPGEAARRTGTTRTSAIEEALTRYLQAPDAEHDVTGAGVRSLLRSIDERLTDSDRVAIRRDLADLYDDTELPAGSWRRRRWSR